MTFKEAPFIWGTLTLISTYQDPPITMRGPHKEFYLEGNVCRHAKDPLLGAQLKQQHDLRTQPHERNFQIQNKPSLGEHLEYQSDLRAQP